MQWIRTGGLMTSYFIMFDSVRRNTHALQTSTGQFFASGCCATLAFWLIWYAVTLFVCLFYDSVIDVIVFILL